MLLALAAPNGARAQAAAQTATLHGRVIDQSGAGVPHAEVSIYADANTLAQTVTDSEGQFSFAGTPREYRVAVRAEGFAPLNSSGIPFTAGGSSRFTLGPASASEGAQEANLPGTAVAFGSGRSRETPVRQLANRRPWEFGVHARGGVGTGDRSDYRFFTVGAHGGKILTSNLGSGLLQGNFEYAVEVLPFWQSYTPRFAKVSCPADPSVPVGSYACSQPYTVGGTFTGVSVTPIILRWNLTHGQRWMPFVQGAGGLIWTNHKFPAIGNTDLADTASNGPHGDTSVWNFTPQFGVGAHYFLKPGRSLDFSADAVHISSASLGDKNPGVNASVQFSVGYTWWR